MDICELGFDVDFDYEEWDVFAWRATNDDLWNRGLPAISFAEFMGMEE